MKKGVLIFSIASLLSTLSFGLVAAQALPAPPITPQQFSNFFTSLLSNTGSILLTRILLVILLLVVIYKPAEKLTGNKSGLGFIVALIISILAIRFLDAPMIMGLLIPYTSMGIALWVIIPFAIMGYFLISSDLPSYFRKMCWVFMLVAFTFLWWQRASELGDMGYIYLLGSFFTVVALVFDNAIKAMIFKAKLELRMSTEDTILLDQLETKLRDIDKGIAAAHTPEAIGAYIKQKAEVTAEMNGIYKQKK